jgi:S1-C subfamily serine protease
MLQNVAYVRPSFASRLSGAVNARCVETTSNRRGVQEIALYKQASPAVVLLKTKEGSGSGVVLQSGQILTNRHVVEGVGTVQIFFKTIDMTQSAQRRWPSTNDEKVRPSFSKSL